MDAQAVIRNLGLWPEAPRIEPIPAGYTNENFRVLAGGEVYFARVGTDLPHHGISRLNEARCLEIAAGAGIAPQVVHASQGVLVTRFVEGTTLKMGQAPGEATLAAVARLLAAVHRQAAPAELEEVDLVGVCRRYLAQPAMHRLPEEDRRRIEKILDSAPGWTGPGCFVHGDAFPENIIDDGRRLWLVDWEYAGRGQAAADLAYVAMNFELPVPNLRAFVEAHGGAVDAELVKALVPVAAARDLLWCVSEIDARGLTTALASYTRRCGRRLKVAWRPR